MTMQAPGAPPLPFHYGRRLKWERVETQADFAPDGAVVDFELPRVGYALGFLLRVSGDAVVSTATIVPKHAGVHNLVRRVTVDFPGESDLYKASGDSIHLLNLIERPLSVHQIIGEDPRLASALDASTIANTQLKNVAALGVATNPWNLLYWLSLTRNARDLRGMRPLGHGGQRARILVQPSTEADLVTTVGNLDASAVNIDCWIAYYDAAPAGVGRPEDYGWDKWAIHVEEIRTPINATGDVKIEVDPDGVILDMLTRVVINDAPSNAVDTVSLDLDRRHAIEERPLFIHLFDSSRRFGVHFPTGVIPWIFDGHAADMEPVDGQLGGVRGREWLFSDEFEDVEPTVSITSGTTLGTVKELVTVVRRLVRV